MNKDRIIGIILILFSLTFIYLTYDMELTVISSESTPRTFPYLASLTILICGIGLFLRKEDREKKAVLTSEGIRRIAILVALMVLYPLGLQFLGFALTSPIVLFAMVNLFAMNKNVKMRNKIIYTATLSAGLYVLFVKVLSAPMPTGLLSKLF